MEKAVEFDSAGRIFGILSEPVGHARKGIVFVHGWSGYRCGPHRMFVNLGRRLDDSGIASLRFDLSGRGDSSGAYHETSLDIMINDTLAAVRFLRDRVAEVFVCGICSGGNAALGAASIDRRIDGLVLLSTPLFIRQKRQLGISDSKTSQVIKNYARKALDSGTWLRLLRGGIDFRGVSSAVAEEDDGGERKDSSRDIMTEMNGYRGRMLYIYGSRDSESPGAPEFYRKFTADSGISARFETIEGADHNFYKGRFDVEAVLLEWLG